MTDRLDILIFGAHPDDAEIGMGGTVAKHTQAGIKVGICDLTHAEMSSNGNVDTRRIEAEEASRILGLTARTNLGLPDRGLRAEKEQIDPIVREIRRFAPRIVFAPYWEDRHPDHVMCSRMVQEAVFNAKLRRYMPEFEAVTVEQLYFYYINDLGPSDLAVDVTAVYETKLNALKAYRSQFTSPGTVAEYVRTPLNQGYIEQVEARDRVTGQKRLVRYAESFTTKQPHLINLF
ncbi:MULTISPECIES: bacillithiol biosynthesis deacetylase BshB1 [unclassified Paenibacillus]|uniref:bacillithiol biosynthesis deacetylase BshB1 n=1 Tax=unclassified Paenibacillus TaxID=185978 RepID=UPI001C0FC861|nr:MULTISPECIES: bacillithiol biosynthesis deacetylase BshB1 [unclassified Paenibacillus]MBU5444000.1 bacillithiol biosynthesis deacetylase BshB1 [Paenibacillus sp. MSJ-34]CAH0118781.1 N-acetyl-alpha-D-glucosaminyl L-malate deacetylase 1 [Paenibacillus sp. CECT 9249]